MRPAELALVRARRDPDRQLQVVLEQVAEHAMDRAAALELVEDQLHDVARLLVRVLDDLARSAGDVADRPEHPELAALRLGELGSMHPLLDEVEFGLADRTLEPEQEPVVVDGRIVDAVEVTQQRPEERAGIDQLIPIAAAACQARHLEADDDADMTQADFGNQVLEAE